MHFELCADHVAACQAKPAISGERLLLCRVAREQARQRRMENTNHGGRKCFFISYAVADDSLSLKFLLPDILGVGARAVRELRVICQSALR